MEVAWNLMEILPSLAGPLLRKRIRRFDPGLIITSNISGWSYAPWHAARRLEIPLVHIVRDYGLICVRSNLLRDDKACIAVCGKCQPRARATYRAWPGGTIVGISASVLENHTRRGMFEEVQRFVSHPRLALGARKASRTPRAPVVFGYLGRLSPEKGVETFLDAGVGIGAAMRVAGDGREDYVSELRRRYPAATFEGHVDASVFLSQIDVLIVPSLWEEPFGRVVGDAAMAGVPCLVAARGGLVEAANAVEAVYREFDPSQPAQLAHLMQAVISGEIEWGQGSADSWPSMPIEDIIDRVLHDSPGGRSS